MSSPFGAGMANSIGSVLGSIGTSATIIRPGTPDTSVYPPVTGTPTTHACTVVIDSYSAMDMAANAGIVAGDVKLLVSTSGLDITPGTGDSVKVGGKTYSVVNVTSVQPGGTVLMYQIQGRKA